MKVFFPTALTLLLSTSSFTQAAAEGILDYSKIKCGISRGCTISCGYGHHEQYRVRHIQEIDITIYENGISRLDLKKKYLRGTQTIIVGPKSYFCDIDNPS